MTAYSEQIHQTAKRSHLAAYYLVYIFCVLVLFDLLTTRGTQGTAWIIGDWLINYSAGFIRRGLIGEVILLASGVLHVYPIFVVVAIQLCLYAWILYVVWESISRLRWKLWLILLFVSPATLSFPIMDSSGGFRKEIVYFAALCGLLYLLKQPRQSEVKISIYLCIVLTVSMLCHEGLFAFTPYYLGALALSFRSGKRVICVALIPAIFLGVTLAAVVTHPGNAEMASTICSSLNLKNPAQKASVCTGAIASLGADPATEKARVALVLSSHHALRLYGWLVLLTCAPAAFALKKAYREKPDPVRAVAIGGSAIAASLLSVPLFLYADDWGRWIYIHIFSIFLLLVFAESQKHDDPSAQDEPAQWLSGIPRKAILVATLLYATCWNLPHVPTYEFHTGYIGLIKHFSQFRHSKTKVVQPQDAS